jgi:glycerophosphoryl diester phosphodiesterase
VAAFTKASPSSTVFLLQHNHPFGILKKAKSVQATGIGVNKNWALLLPHYYWHARRNQLEIYTYTVNNRILAALFLLLMPKLLICTDVPHTFTAVPNIKRAIMAASILIGISIISELILVAYRAALV